MEGKETSMSQRRSVPIREDCWSEAATFTLIEAWGDRYLELNRGNLRQKHWQEVADAVNARHGAVKKQRRTDVQCKNRIDTLKKKYKIEKTRVSSTWPFFSRLDALIGTTVTAYKKPSPSPPPPPPPLALPLAPRKIPPSLPQAAAVRSTKEKRSRSRSGSPEAVPVDDSFFRRNYSAEAAAAAAASADGDSGTSRSSTESRRRNGDGDGVDGAVDGFMLLARAIKRFGKIYKRVEGAKQQQMIELEKQRMEFAKSLEFQRMQLFMDSQVQLEKIKHAKRASADNYL